MESPFLVYAPKSGNTYYFRSKIPTDLISHFAGKHEFRIFLKCAIKSRSNRITKILNKIVLKLYEEIRRGVKELSIEEIKEIFRIEIRKQILHAQNIDLGTNKWDDSGVQTSLDSIAQKESKLRSILKSDLNSYQVEIDAKLKGILDSLDIKVKQDSVPYKTLMNHFIDLDLVRHEWMRELVNKTGKLDDDFRRDGHTNLDLELFPDLSNPPVITSI